MRFRILLFLCLSVVFVSALEIAPEDYIPAEFERPLYYKFRRYYDNLPDILVFLK